LRKVQLKYRRFRSIYLIGPGEPVTAAMESEH
jgi:hypothetical protein